MEIEISFIHHYYVYTLAHIHTHEWKTNLFSQIYLQSRHFFLLRHHFQIWTDPNVFRLFICSSTIASSSLSFKIDVLIYRLFDILIESTRSINSSSSFSKRTRNRRLYLGHFNFLFIPTRNVNFSWEIFPRAKNFFLYKRWKSVPRFLIAVMTIR